VGVVYAAFQCEPEPREEQPRTRSRTREVYDKRREGTVVDAVRIVFALFCRGRWASVIARMF
jgi:hypothetical protein